MRLDSLLVTGVFMIGMAVGALLMKIRLMSIVANVVAEQLHQETSPMVRVGENISS